MPYICGLDILLGVAALNATGVTNAQAKGTSQTSSCQGAEKLSVQRHLESNGLVFGNPVRLQLLSCHFMAFLQYSCHLMACVLLKLAAVMPIFGMFDSNQAFKYNP